MPRPEFSSSGRKNAKKSGISKWIEGRKERKKALAEEAAKMITDDTAKNETTIVNILSGIDFMHSRLPKEVIEAKSNENRTCGDLEFAARAVCKKILKNPQSLSLDLRKIDEKLITIAILFKEAVEQGDRRAANAAKCALIRGVNDIRSRIPENNPELFKEFVEANAKYLDTWIELIGIAQVADRTEQNLAAQNELLKVKEEKNNKRVEDLKNTIQSDKLKEEIFVTITNHDSIEERAKWTEEEREMHKLLVDRRMDRVNLQLDSLIVQQMEMELTTQQNQVEVLYSKVASQKIVADPNLMNKFREEVNLMFDQLAASDAEIDENLRLFDDIEGRVRQMDYAPGAARAREVAAEEGELLAKEIRDMQLQATGERAKNSDAKLKSLGILTKEEEINMIREAEEEEKRAFEELQESLEALEDEGEVLYN